MGTYASEISEGQWTPCRPRAPGHGRASSHVHTRRGGHSKGRHNVRGRPVPLYCGRSQGAGTEPVAGSNMIYMKHDVVEKPHGWSSSTGEERVINQDRQASSPMARLCPRYRARNITRQLGARRESLGFEGTGRMRRKWCCLQRRRGQCNAFFPCGAYENQKARCCYHCLSERADAASGRWGDSTGAAWCS